MVFLMQEFLVCSVERAVSPQRLWVANPQNPPCLPLHSVRLMGFKSDIFVFCVCVHVRKKKKKYFCALIRKRACKQMSRNLDFAELKAQTAELKALGNSLHFQAKRKMDRRKRRLTETVMVYACVFDLALAQAVCALSAFPLECCRLWQPRGFEWHRHRVMGTQGMQIGRVFFNHQFHHQNHQHCICITSVSIKQAAPRRSHSTK